MERVRAFQNQILRTSPIFREDMPLSSAVTDAFFKVPRHDFVQKFFRADQYKWIYLTSHNLNEHLPYIYRDAPLIIHKEDGVPISTISQPSFVLAMLEMLDLKSGQSVFELGTGSGWSAALMAEIVGLNGHVDTIEILPYLADLARERLKTWPQVRVLTGNGAEPNGDLKVYDRVVFTAGAYDVPRFLFERVKPGGLFLFVLRDDDGPDILILFQKQGESFHCMRSMLCSFVLLQGHTESSEDIFLDEMHDGKRRLEDYDFDVYPIGASVSGAEGRLIAKHKESQFVWSRKTDHLRTDV